MEVFQCRGPEWVNKAKLPFTVACLLPPAPDIGRIARPPSSAKRRCGSLFLPDTISFIVPLRVSHRLRAFSLVWSHHRSPRHEPSPWEPCGATRDLKVGAEPAL